MSFFDAFLEGLTGGSLLAPAPLPGSPTMLIADDEHLEFPNKDLVTALVAIQLRENAERAEQAQAEPEQAEARAAQELSRADVLTKVDELVEVKTQRKPLILDKLLKCSDCGNEFVFRLVLPSNFS